MISPDKLVLLVVHFAGGKLSGKTLLQKRIYFLSKLLKIETGFTAHFYGPYSDEITSGLERAKALGFIQEQNLGFGASDESGFEIRRYDYALTDDGGKIVRQLESQMPMEYRQVESALNKMSEAGDTGDYLSLSIAAKSYHILSEKKGPMTPHDIRAEAQKLGWRITPGAVDRAADFLEKLGLITKSKN